MPRTFSTASLAILFVGTGLLTYQVYYWVARSNNQLFLQLVTGLPFGIACSLRFMQPRKWVVLAVFLDCFAWLAAFRLGLALAGNVNPYFGMALAGMVGALGVTASTGLGCPALLGRRTLVGAALVGAIAGGLFGLALNRSAQENLILAISFPVWQVAIGLWIASAPSRSLIGITADRLQSHS